MALSTKDPKEMKNILESIRGKIDFSKRTHMPSYRDGYAEGGIFVLIEIADMLVERKGIFGILTTPSLDGNDMNVIVQKFKDQLTKQWEGIENGFNE